MLKATSLPVAAALPVATSLVHTTNLCRMQPEGPTSEFNPEGGAVEGCRAPSGALSGALNPA